MVAPVAPFTQPLPIARAVDVSRLTSGDVNSLLTTKPTRALPCATVARSDRPAARRAGHEDCKAEGCPVPPDRS